MIFLMLKEHISILLKKKTKINNKTCKQIVGDEIIRYDYL